MASALAPGFGEPVLVTDVVPEQAQALASELGGEALATNAEVAERADVLVLCHKPAQLEDVARSVAGKSEGDRLDSRSHAVEALERAYPDLPVYRFMPSIPAEVRPACPVTRRAAVAADGTEREVLELFERVGPVVQRRGAPDRARHGHDELRPRLLRARGGGPGGRRREARPPARHAGAHGRGDDGRHGGGAARGRVRHGGPAAACDLARWIDRSRASRRSSAPACGRPSTTP